MVNALTEGIKEALEAYWRATSSILEDRKQMVWVIFKEKWLSAESLRKNQVRHRPRRRMRRTVMFSKQLTMPNPVHSVHAICMKTCRKCGDGVNGKRWD